jgi:hypothetical protein
MDRTFMVFAAVAVGALFVVTDFVKDIQSDDEQYRNNDYNQMHKYDKYKVEDSIGQAVLDLENVNPSVQISAWNTSNLKDEFLLLFPDFDDMKNFIKERTRGDDFHSRMLKKINLVEDQFFSGTINAEKAKRMLSLVE